MQLNSASGSGALEHDSSCIYARCTEVTIYFCTTFMLARQRIYSFGILTKNVKNLNKKFGGSSIFDGKCVDVDHWNVFPYELNPERREKIKLKFLFSHLFVVSQKVLRRPLRPS